jgi:hypothetical protein
MKTLKINKKYMAIALRFLKETGLLPFWKEYVIKEINEGKRFQTEHWSMNTNKKNYIDQIFGFTTFTNFVLDKINEKKNRLNNREGECEIIYSLPSVFLLFGAWLTANSSLYGEYTLEGGTPRQSTISHIIVDTKKRKATILLEEYFENDYTPKRIVTLGQVLKEINALC